MSFKIFTNILVWTSIACLSNNAFAAKLNGRIIDAQTGEELVGCAVYISQLEMGTTTGFDGTYELRNVPVGKYTVQVRCMTYENQIQTIDLSSDSQVLNINFALSPSVEILNEVVVVSGLERNTENSARASEKKSNQILNVVSAKSIELSPDLNVAAVVQRISGVTLERNSTGDGQYAILRGMDKRYNYTLVNGIKIPSPNNKHRYLSLDLFPSELLDRVEVTKSLSADMEGDATGGVINLVMKDAPARLLVQANVAAGYNSRFINNDFVGYSVNDIDLQSPRQLHGNDYTATMGDFNNQSGKLSYYTPLPNAVAGITIGNRFFGNQLGFVVAANYQNIYKGSSSTFFEDEMLQTESAVRLTSQKDRTYSENQSLYGVHAKLEYRLSPLHKIEWYNAFIYMQNAQVRQTTSTNLKLNYYPANGNLDLAYQTRIRTQKQKIISTTLQGNHRFNDHFSATWAAVYSLATNQLPENTQINIDNLRQNFVDFIYADADGSTRRWEHNSDHDYSAYLNFTHDAFIGDYQLTFKGGGLYRSKKRDNSYVNYRFKPLNGSQVYGTDFTTLDQIQWTLYTPEGSVGPLEYDADENIAAAYFNALVNLDKFQISAGVRAENTDQGYFMYFPNADDSPEGNQSYTDILPSIQLKLASSNQTQWKASYFRSINRPGFFEIVPYQITNEEYTEYGNKDLVRAVIDNVDFRWEYFPKQNEQMMVGVFYKHIKNPIEYAYFTTNYRQYGYGPMNLGDAVNLGVELDFIKFVHNFGIKTNYTFTHSSITTSKAYYGTDENGSYKRFFKDQTRPLVGQAKHVANLSLMYKNTSHGWDAQLASSYTGEKINIASHYYNSDYWQAPSFQLDASIEKKFDGGISLFVKVNNIINTPRREYIKTSNPYNSDFQLQSNGNEHTTIRKDNEDRTMLVGCRFKL